MVSQTGPRWSDLIFAWGQIYPGKGPNQNVGPASVIWDQISEIWPQKGLPGNPDTDVQYCELYIGNQGVCKGVRVNPPPS